MTTTGTASIPASQDLQPVFDILALIADRSGRAEAVLQELADKAGEVRGLIEQAATASADLDAKAEAHADRIKTETADHEQRLENERTVFEAEHDRREKAMRQMEAHTDRLHDEAVADREAAANLRADLENRSKAMRDIVRAAGTVVNTPTAAH